MIVKKEENRVEFENLFSIDSKFNSNKIVIDTKTKVDIEKFPASNSKGSLSKYNSIEDLYQSSKESAENYGFLE